MIIEKYREKTKMARSVWWDKEDNTEKGTLEVKELFNGKVFDFPKSVEMIEKLVEMGSNKQSADLVLDFFSGSGTTAHAVMELNAKDGGNRKWICVQLPEETDENSEARKTGFTNIAQIARERIRRAGKKIAKGDIGLKTYILTASNYRVWDTLTPEDDAEKLLKQSKLALEKPLVDKYDENSVVYEILLKEGLDLNSKIEKDKNGNYNVIDSDKKIAVSFAEKINQEKVDELCLNESDLFVCFDSALDDTTKVNMNRRKFNVKVI